MSAAVTSTRLVICVDGTWSTADGREHDPKGNQTNMFRIASSVKKGHVIDHEGRPFIQKRKYYNGIGVGKKTVGRLNDGLYGTGCHEQIKAVYQYCCQHLSGQGDDEIWLYGFSRGAYVVRAVAGLIHHLRLLKFESQREFDDNYNKAVNRLLTHIKNNDKDYRGQLWLYFSDEIKGPVKLQFIGVFDTVKAFDDKNLFDISFADSIHHFRHAVSLNEDRLYFDPELVYPLESPEALSWSRSMIQAWFLGAHVDLGGGAKDDGLSLYPLQWMLIESKRYGLILEFVPVEGRDTVEDPLTVIFPKADQLGATTNSEDAIDSWHIEYKSGIKVEMCDLRLTHRHPNSHKQRKRFKTPWSNDSDIISTASTYHNRINWTNGISVPSPRKPFKDHWLVGYHDNMTYGTILHPSVYFLLDVYPQIYSSARISGFREEIERFRIAAFPDDIKFPWVTGTYVLENENDVKAFRILVCGKAGAGKSTLINRVFGECLTKESAVKHGEHDIDVAFQSEFSPGLFIHDSRGFTTGSSRNVKTVENFLKKRSATSDVMQRVHAIWLCVKTDEERFINDADTNLFKTLKKYATGVPIIVVGTMKDNIVNRFRGEVEPTLDEELYTDREAKKKEMEARVQEKFVERQNTFAEGWRGIQQSRIVYTAKNDADSINSLLQTTLECLDNEELRVWVVGSQVCDVEQKVETAIGKSIRLCRETIVTTSTAPMASIIVAPTMGRLVCNIALRAFGFGKVSEKQFEEIMREVVWRNTSRFFYKTLGILAVEAFTLASIGPFALPILAAETLLAIPRTVRVVVACACDAILILEHAFSVNGQRLWPTEIRKSANEYKAKMRAVHSEVDQLIPIWNPIGNKFYKGMPQLRGGMEEIIQNHRKGGKDKLPDASDDG